MWLLARHILCGEGEGMWLLARQVLCWRRGRVCGY